jgi:hypothetical protein
VTSGLAGSHESWVFHFYLINCILLMQMPCRQIMFCNSAWRSQDAVLSELNVCIRIFHHSRPSITRCKSVENTWTPARSRRIVHALWRLGPAWRRPFSPNLDFWLLATQLNVNWQLTVVVEQQQHQYGCSSLGDTIILNVGSHDGDCSLHNTNAPGQ